MLEPETGGIDHTHAVEVDAEVGVVTSDPDNIRAGYEDSGKFFSHVLALQVLMLLDSCGSTAEHHRGSRRDLRMKSLVHGARFSYRSLQPPPSHYRG